MASAYTHLILDDSLNGKIFNLCGEATTQQELTDVINEVFGLELVYQEMGVEEYIQDRIMMHGEFLGPIIAGIYRGIRDGAFRTSHQIMTQCVAGNTKPCYK